MIMSDYDTLALTYRDTNVTPVTQEKPLPLLSEFIDGLNVEDGVGSLHCFMSTAEKVKIIHTESLPPPHTHKHTPFKKQT